MSPPRTLLLFFLAFLWAQAPGAAHAQRVVVVEPGGSIKVSTILPKTERKGWKRILREVLAVRVEGGNGQVTADTHGTAKVKIRATEAAAATTCKVQVGAVIEEMPVGQDSGRRYTATVPLYVCVNLPKKMATLVISSEQRAGFAFPKFAKIKRITSRRRRTAEAEHLGGRIMIQGKEPGGCKMTIVYTIDDEKYDRDLEVEVIEGRLLLGATVMEEKVASVSIDSIRQMVPFEGGRITRFLSRGNESIAHVGVVKGQLVTRGVKAGRTTIRFAFGGQEGKTTYEARVVLRIQVTPKPEEDG